MLLRIQDLTHCDLALAYEYDDLCPEEMMLFERHLEVCEPCRAFVSSRPHQRLLYGGW
jgi:hypothetical protein